MTRRMDRIPRSRSHKHGRLGIICLVVWHLKGPSDTQFGAARARLDFTLKWLVRWLPCSSPARGSGARVGWKARQDCVHCPAIRPRGVPELTSSTPMRSPLIRAWALIRARWSKRLQLAEPRCGLGVEQEVRRSPIQYAPGLETAARVRLVPPPRSSANSRNLSTEFPVKSRDVPLPSKCASLPRIHQPRTSV
jgi:hypothetical protein